MLEELSIMYSQKIIDQLQQLRLSTMVNLLEQQESSMEVHNMTFDERLSMLLSAEISSRENTKITRLLKQSKIRQFNATIENIHYSPQRGLNRALIASLSTCDWIRQHKSVLLTGNTGTGKSWIASALGVQACRDGLNVQFYTMTQLFEQISVASQTGMMPKLRNHMLKAKLLIIDDFGIGGMNNQLVPILLDLLDQQSICGGLMITSQLPISNWYDLFSDATIADALLDRIVHRAYRIELKGESMRKVILSV